MITALIFLGVLFLLILVHEWGHFIVAKKVGMKVEEFGIGFPPKIFGYKKGETEYTFNIFPIGGFVRIFGENPQEVVDADDKERSFSARPRWAQALVLVAGVVMNVGLAWMLYIGVFMIGSPSAVSESDAGPEAVLTVVSLSANSPAQEAIPMGVTITEISFQDEVFVIENPSQLSEAVSSSQGEPLQVTYTHNNQEETTTVTPVQGLIEQEPDRYAIGVQAVLIEFIQYGFFTSIVMASQQTIEMLSLIVTSIADLLYNTVVGQADFSQVAGPIGIYNLVGDAASIGMVSLMMFTAIISLNLAVINLFPFPALDGGRLIIVGIESVIRRDIDPIWVGRLNLIGFILLITLMIAVTYNDILRL